MRATCFERNTGDGSTAQVQLEAALTFKTCQRLFCNIQHSMPTKKAKWLQVDNNDGGDREMQDGWRVVRDGPGVMESTDGILRDGAPLLDRYLCPPPWAPPLNAPRSESRI